MTESAYFEDMAGLDERARRGPETGKTVTDLPRGTTYEQWKAQFVDNSAKDGILASQSVMLIGVPHITIHSHPDGLTFTLKDVTRLLKDDRMSALSAVGNNGVIYWLEKEIDIDLIRAHNLLTAEYKKRSAYLKRPESYSCNG